MTEFVEQLSFSQLVLLCGAFFGGLIAVFTGAGFALENWLGSSRRIFDLPRAEGQLRWELVGTLRFVVMAAFSFAVLLSVVPFAEESVGSAISTFIFCWLGFEIYYWGLHRLMHFRPIYRFHRYHHDSRVTSPLTGYSMSTVESLGWLVGLAGVPFLLSLFVPISLPGLVAYHTLYQIAGNVLGHSNVDFFPAAAEKRRNFLSRRCGEAPQLVDLAPGRLPLPSPRSLCQSLQFRKQFHGPPAGHRVARLAGVACAGDQWRAHAQTL
ncbi:MAG: sterol desaturase family protein [Deltaproteobacteria bacterium]|nr:sterol desaturase family protein [Deltaproteobacteria bacterium]